jgi:spore germination cell wall hydrolase CwlJ-like protein
MTRRRRPQHHWLWAAFTLCIVLVALGISLAASLGGRSGNRAMAAGAGAPPPAVQPVELMALAPEDARTANAAQPFVGNVIPAAPFQFTGDSANAGRAVDCLTAAVLYEAGDDAVGQRAVAQVVINRARHPAFTPSICGVVFQGSERRTGCQFTFTCDGALNRRYSDGAWQRARGIAIDALNGAVDRSVGLATHYHTDWVRPYWSPSLDKIAQVGTHLFFRWPGHWGSPQVFRSGLTGQEPLIGKMALLSPAHAGGAVTAMPGDVDGIAPPSAETVRAAINAVLPRQNRVMGDVIMLYIDRAQPPATFPALAQAACGDRPYCKVMGWTDASLIPSSEAMSDTARAAMSFSYLRDQPRGLERALWNCAEFAREQPRQCMRR